MSDVLHKINQDIDALMGRISDRIGSKYKLTLICRYIGDDFKDADILKSDDDFESAIESMRELMKRNPV